MIIMKRISHRGLPSQYCENSINAIIEKIDKYDGIEFDVQFTKDKKIIIFHDETYERIYGYDKKVSETLYSDIIEISKDHVVGRISTLEELFEILSTLSISEKIINIELKIYDSSLQELYDSVKTLINKYNIKYQIIMSSFDKTIIYDDCYPIFDNDIINTDLLQNKSIMINNKSYYNVIEKVIKNFFTNDIYTKKIFRFLYFL